jgi:hypothetical protein
MNSNRHSNNSGMKHDYKKKNIKSILVGQSFENTDT